MDTIRIQVLLVPMIDFRTGRSYPGGKLCLYMHLSPPFGHVQNQPYFPFSTASTKNLHTLSVVVLGLPCLLMTTCRSFSSSVSVRRSPVSQPLQVHKPSSQSAISSFFLSSSSFSLVSLYKSFFSPLRSTLKSWLNLHFFPFSQFPCL